MKHPQSLAGLIRQRLAFLEQSIEYGIRHQTLLNELNRQGFEASIGTFRTSLWRARCWWRDQMQTPNQSVRTGLTDTTLSSKESQPVGEIARATTQEKQHKPTEKESTRIKVPTQLTSVSDGEPDIDIDQFFKPKNVFGREFL